MTADDIIKAVLQLRGIPGYQLAHEIGWAAQKLSKRLSNETMRIHELYIILDHLDVDLTLTDRRTGEQIHPKCAGMGEPVVRYVDKVRYSTEKSSAIANNFFADGENKYNDGRASELYMDSAGRYFFAEYCEWDPSKNSIIPVSKEKADEFVRKYGTRILKHPKIQIDE